MAQATLTTITLVREALPLLSETDISEATLQDAIDEARDVIYDDLSKFINWDNLEDLDTIPRVLRRLGKYRSVMEIIVRHFNSDEVMFGTGDIEENTVYNHYKKLYDGLIEQLSSGEITILDDDNEEVTPSVARPTGLGRVI